MMPAGIFTGAGLSESFELMSSEASLSDKITKYNISKGPPCQFNFYIRRRVSINNKFIQMNQKKERDKKKK